MSALITPKTDHPLRKEFLARKVCKNCSGRIPKPKLNNLQRVKFCSDNCRKEFHKNNGISVHKLKDQVKRWVREEWAAIKAEEARV